MCKYLHQNTDEYYIIQNVENYKKNFKCSKKLIPSIKTLHFHKICCNSDECFSNYPFTNG